MTLRLMWSAYSRYIQDKREVDTEVGGFLEGFQEPQAFYQMVKET